MHQQVRAKKHLGQHFLTDHSIAQRIAYSLQLSAEVLEIGAGMGILTRYLLQNPMVKSLSVVEIDAEAVDYLRLHFPELTIHQGDFLQMNLRKPISIAGNFPYNISNQILFKIFADRMMVEEVVGMFQKEVAERITAKEGTKARGILSVLLSACYRMEYLFTVNEDVFNPPPKVKSAVVRMTRTNISIPCNEVLFQKVVKTAFNQRRKMLRSALKPLNIPLTALDDDILSKRAEQLSVEEFIMITQKLNNQ
ncbi:MAG: 16S rRNA (adenine(1518)-N(6)/adenine(1519)-N(6))-dimethyltransferase RsmA [Bacteroidales bacterium]|nr:16S rRNA (adenine(1518)-N(6)/adenine(1519)-N(6))-dimethyltransferase RsmA [Bacteroidales bacterium]